ncbi:MAG: transposase [Bacteroidota bacterium]
MKKSLAYTYKLKLTSQQAVKAEEWMGTCRLIYNMALSICKESRSKLGKNVYRQELQKQVTQLREAFQWIRDVQSQVLQSPLIRLENAFKKTTAGGGYPKYKKKGASFSFTFPQNVSFEKGRFFLPKFGWVKVHRDRWPEGKIRQATVRYECGEWFLSVSFAKEIAPLLSNENQVGIDMGVAHMYATSDGYLEDSLQIYRSYLARLRVEQRALSRKVKYSSNWTKQKKRIAKIHRKIARKRADFHQKKSMQLIYKYGLLAIEDLKLRNLTHSAKGTLMEPGTQVKAKSGLNRSILDAGIGNFVRMLEYKADWYGRKVVKVNPMYTSQQCRACGSVNKQNRHKESFVCTSCGHKAHADVNAAKNILARAMASVPKRKAVA